MSPSSEGFSPSGGRVLTLTGKDITKTDRQVIRLFVGFALGVFLSHRQIAKQDITIKFVDPKTVYGEARRDLKTYQAWMENYTGESKFDIIVNAQMLYKTDNTLRRLRSALLCIGHELVHVKQYVKGEMRDYANGDAGWKGKRYSNWDTDDENYWFSPWEIEAYGHEPGLFACFKQAYKEVLSQP